MISISDIKADFPVYGQQLKIDFLLNEFIAAHQDENLMRNQFSRLQF
jgi:hypothetical protein